MYHVSEIPNHQVGRNTSIETRGIVAMAGNFGYELDITKLSEKEKNTIYNIYLRNTAQKSD